MDLDLKRLLGNNQYLYIIYNFVRVRLEERLGDGEI